MKAKFVVLALSLAVCSVKAALVTTTFSFDNMGSGTTAAGTKLAPDGTVTTTAPYMSANQDLNRITGQNAGGKGIEFSANSGTLTFVLSDTSSSSLFQVTYYSQSQDQTTHKGADANTWTAVAGANTATVTISPAYSRVSTWTQYTVTFNFATPVTANQITFTDTFSGASSGTTDFDQFALSAVVPEPTNIALGLFGVGFVGVAAGRKYLRKPAQTAALS